MIHTRNKSTQLEPHLRLESGHATPRIVVRCESEKLSLHDFVYVFLPHNARRFRRRADRIGRRLLREAEYWRRAAHELVPNGHQLSVNRDDFDLRISLDAVELPLPKLRSGARRPASLVRKRIRKAVRTLISLREACHEHAAKWADVGGLYRLERYATTSRDYYEARSPEGDIVACGRDLRDLLDEVAAAGRQANNGRPIGVQLDPGAWPDRCKRSGVNLCDEIQF